LANDILVEGQLLFLASKALDVPWYAKNMAVFSAEDKRLSWFMAFADFRAFVYDRRMFFNLSESGLFQETKTNTSNNTTLLFLTPLSTNQSLIGFYNHFFLRKKYSVPAEDKIIRIMANKNPYSQLNA